MCDAHTNKTTLKCIMYVLFRKLHSNLQVTKHRCGVVWCGVWYDVVWCGVVDDLMKVATVTPGLKKMMKLTNTYRSISIETFPENDLQTTIFFLCKL